MATSRREFLLGTAAAGSALMLGGLEARAAAPASAQAAPAQAQVASIYRHKVGDMLVTSFLDGYLIRPLTVLPDGNTDEGKRLLAEHFMDTAQFQFPVNCHAVAAGGRLMLVDTGGRNVLGPTAGRFHGLLRAAGYDPAQVGTVLLTHMHPDHVSGLVSPEGKALFPNAELVVHENEWKHWHSDENMNKAPEAARGAFKFARAGGGPYKDRLRLVFNLQPLEGPVFESLMEVSPDRRDPVKDERWLKFFRRRGSALVREAERRRSLREGGHREIPLN